MKRLLFVCVVIATLGIVPVFGQKTDITLWTFQELHLTFYQKMAEKWNAAHPKEMINLKGEVFSL